jgi:transcriptional regulator GlxA family with amidase domain
VAAVELVGRGPHAPGAEAFELGVDGAVVGDSERHLARLFVRELGISPSRHVDEVRLEAARARFEAGAASSEVIAHRSGRG